MNSPISLVCIIDDSEDDNFFHKLAIEETGLAEQLHVEPDPLRALSDLTQQVISPSLLLLDIHMPQMTGWNLLEELALVPELTLPTVIVMLPNLPPPASMLQESALQWVSGFVAKPITPASFRDLVRTYVDLPTGLTSQPHPAADRDALPELPKPPQQPPQPEQGSE